MQSIHAQSHGNFRLTGWSHAGRLLTSICVHEGEARMTDFAAGHFGEMQNTTLGWLSSRHALTSVICFSSWYSKGKIRSSILHAYHQHSADFCPLTSMEAFLGYASHDMTGHSLQRWRVALHVPRRRSSQAANIAFYPPVLVLLQR